MLNNFIYAQSKAMFEERIAEVPNEAIVFIEDTKEIWNHGHYFAGEGVDPVAFDNLQTEVSQMKADKQDTLISGTNIKTINGNSILGEGNIDISGYDDTEIKTNLETVGKMAYEAAMRSSNHENAVIPELREEIAAVQPMISVTWSELKEMRDNATLKPGQQYRITDYVTTTSQAETQSAGHPFDVIVTADSENTLNEEARACIHEGDTYFSDAGAKLEAWKIWYCLDNDKNRFSWAVAKTNKSISVDIEDMTLPAEYVGTYEYDGTMFHKWDFFFSGSNGSFLTTSENPQVGDSISILVLEGDFLPYPLPIVSVSEPSENEGFGVIYRMIDEQNNDVSYDFKNIQFVRKVTLGKLDLENGTDEFVFTFNSFDESVGRSSDFSFKPLCYNNNIKKCVAGLNNIVFLNENTECYSNTFGDSCYGNTFGDSCHSNTFEDNCYSNTFGDSCYGNTFGDNCYGNTFGDNCIYNTFGDSCSYNTFGDSCSYNTFGDICSNTFGDSCSYNTFGDNCHSNTFGDNCHSNTFGDSCSYNTFGDSCSYNTFGDICYGNTFGDSCSYNSFGNACNYNSFRSSASSTASLKNYFDYNHFDDGCSYNVIWNSNTTGPANALRNINVNKGVSGTNSNNYNFINIDTLNADYEIQVAKNSKGEIKIYCEADLIA